LNEIQQRIFSNKEADKPKDRLERRRETRIEVDRPVYVQPIEQDVEHFEEVRRMRNFSRNGFYFVSERVSYQPGAYLYVVPAFGCLNLEYLGEVVRVERLADGEFGIAVRLLRVVNTVAGLCTTTMEAFKAFALLDGSPLAISQPYDSSNSSLVDSR
jgi:hypothetical protein